MGYEVEHKRPEHSLMTLGFSYVRNLTFRARNFDL